MKNKLSKGLSLSLSVNPKHSISERFKASTHGFRHFGEKFESERNTLFSVILGHTLNVILGFIPRIHAEHLSNVILGLVPRIHAEHSSVDTRDTPEYDNRKRMYLKPENDYKVMQCGRSMIEMLGVLAIIGVLSVGGIAGYSKAMTKFKTNTVLSQFSTIINNIQTLYIQQKDFNNLNTETAIQMGIIPDEMIASDRLSAFDALGDSLLIDNSQDAGVMDGNYFLFGVYLTSKESCLALAQSDWRTFNPLFVILENEEDETNSLAYCAPDFTACDQIREDYGISKIKQIPFSPADTALACSTCEDENCIFGMYIPK